MKVELRVVTHVPYNNKFLSIGTVLEVIKEVGIYYVCKNDEVESILIQKAHCEVIDDEENQDT